MPCLNTCKTWTGTITETSRSQSPRTRLDEVCPTALLTLMAIDFADRQLVSKSKMTPNVRRVLTSQKTFANHLADEEAALAQKPSSAVPIPNAATSNNSKSKSKSRPSSKEAKDPLEANLLLRTYIPSEPSPEVMQALISAPPLSYNAARAVLPSTGRPPRHFCEICGYWGTVKCMKCGVRVCSLECQGTHDEGRCLKFYG